FFQAEDGIRDRNVTGVQTCALPISYVALRPMRSESDAQKKRPPMLKSEIRPVNPAATAAEAPKISWSIGDAIPMTPMPALTFRRSEERRVGKECRYGGSP